jgi:hypothetical protein
MVPRGTRKKVAPHAERMPRGCRNWRIYLHLVAGAFTCDGAGENPVRGRDPILDLSEGVRYGFFSKFDGTR